MKVKKSGAFTVREKRITSFLLSEVQILDTVNPIKDEKTWTALWDTGATCTFISKEVADRMGLTPTTYVPVDTIKEHGKEASRYNIRVVFPNDFSTVVHAVEWPWFSDGVDIVIGMDIISQGDFSITNPKNRTVFSFRIPSVKEVDYEKDSLTRD